MYLLDTMVVSESFKRQPNEHVRRWLDGTRRDRLFISVISFGEIADGVVRARKKDPAFAARLASWAASMQAEFGARTIPFDLPAAICWGDLYAELGRQDLDLLIAATALTHDLTVVTRNVRHFEPTGVRLLDAYEA
ncbi:type II toxin-antitoxin system VapC family toxin [Mangrovibrevibacter kandeliae]|uniref:type II toxin-antitoxin system VapC family toxin n=1 Tax=Mangrovibrevibacter kandeliae TaxID=2968473 RepID=UPI0021179EAE|nr:type II toxin-antitoxin system VapC family toxin [Aurantimonas sp. CSK15Z-1]MCQ8782866.1 type II toxin-antitoxin system VapC family toxin [Aurantimonas sp. CSK15Z-1]